MRIFLQVLAVENIYSLAFLRKNGDISPFLKISKEEFQRALYKKLFHNSTIIQSDDIISELEDIFVMFNHQDSITLIQKFFDHFQ